MSKFKFMIVMTFFCHVRLAIFGEYAIIFATHKNKETKTKIKIF